MAKCAPGVSTCSPSHRYIELVRMMYRYGVMDISCLVRESEAMCAFSAGQSGAGVQTEQSGGCHLHGLSSGRREQLRGGERGRLCLHSLSPREVSAL